MKHSGSKVVALLLALLMAGSFLSLIPIAEQTTSGMTDSSDVALSTQSPIQCPAPQVTSGSNSTFSLFWITNTYFLSNDHPGLFKNTTQWIAKYYAACNGRMVVDTGDTVDHTSSVGGQTCNKTNDYGSEWANDKQWKAANQAMTALLDANIPYTWDAGNHDGCAAPIRGGDSAGSLANGWIGWNYAAFNASTVQKASLNWTNAAWVSSDNDSMDTAVSFTGAGQNFLLVNIQFNGVDELASNGWVQRLLSNPSYKDYHVIIATHDFIDNLGGTDLPYFPTELTCLMDGCNGQKGYPNVFLTLNGHFDDTDHGYHIETVSGQYELTFNREFEDGHKGGATVAILTFDLANDKIYVNTFDLNNPSPGEDYRPLTSRSYRYPLDESFQLNQSSEFPVTCVPSPVSVGSPVTCEATVSGSSPTGSVTWSSNNAAEGVAPSTAGFSSASCTLVEGACSVTFTPTKAVDLHPRVGGNNPTPAVIIIAKYGGDSNNGPSVGTASLIVYLYTTAVLSCSPSSVVVGSATTCEATVKGSGSTPTGSVAWSSSSPGKFSSTSCRLSKGACSVKFTPTAADSSMSLQANYEGDSKNSPSSGAYNMTVTLKASKTTISCSPINVPAASPKIVTCKAKVAGYSPTGTMTWSQNGTGSVSFVTIICTLSKSSCSVTMTGAQPGNAVVQASYGGDSNNTPGSGTHRLEVGKELSTATIGCSSKLGVGVPVACTATVSGYSPTGTVTWARVSGTGTVTFSSNTCTLSSGSCQVTVTATRAGSLKIKAVYSGDSNDLTSAGTLVLTIT